MTNLMKSVLPAFLLIALFHQTAFSQSREAGFEAMMMEKWDKAIEIYSSLTKADNTDQDAWLTVGNAWLAKGDKTKAQEAFNAGFTAKPEGPLAYICNGRLLLLQGRQAEADEQFEKAFKKAKKDMVAHRQIGESYFFFIANGDRKPNLARATELLKRL
jgi:tetratricopeptide (TPR) repeat protein